MGKKVKKELTAEQQEEKEIAKYFDTMAKHLYKLTTRISKNMGDNNQSIDFLLEHLDSEPLVFALSSEIGARKFFKWALADNIKRNQALIDKITKIEQKHNLPLEYPD